MRPVLLDIRFSLDVALAFLGVFVAWCAIHLRVAEGMPWTAAIRRGLASCFTFGSKGSTEKADLSVPGSLGTVALALGLVGLVREPVHLPIFGYAAMAFSGFTFTALAGMRTGPRLGVAPNTAIKVAFLCAFFGILGSRAFEVVEFWDDEYADQPARILFGDVLPKKGQDLNARTSAGVQKVVFTGDEKTPSDVIRALAPLSTIGARAVVVAVDRREWADVQHLERGFSVETVERGDRAALTLSGSILGDRSVSARGVSPPWWQVFAIWQGGLVYYGGMIFGTLAVLVFVKVTGGRIAGVADLASSVGAIGVAFGRMGCFLNGCCWGRRADVPWSIRFPLYSPAWLQHAGTRLGAEWDPVLVRQVPPPTSLPPDLQEALTKAGAPQLCEASWPLHPVQLYAIGLLLLTFVVLYNFAMRKARREWQTFFLWFVIYGCVRFTVEHFRADSDSYVWLLGYPLTPSQRVVVLTVPVAIAGFIWATKKGRPLVPWQPPAEPSTPAGKSAPGP